MGILFAEADKRRAFAVHVIAVLLLVMAALAPAVARTSGFVIALAYAVTLHGQWRCWRQAATWRHGDG